MTYNRLTSPVCGCTGVSDKLNRVLRLRTCPVCQHLRLDFLRGREYARSYVKGVDTLLVQKELFSLQSMQSGSQAVPGL